MYYSNKKLFLFTSTTFISVTNHLITNPKIPSSAKKDTLKSGATVLAAPSASPRPYTRPSGRESPGPTRENGRRVGARIALSIDAAAALSSYLPRSPPITPSRSHSRARTIDAGGREDGRGTGGDGVGGSSEQHRCATELVSSSLVANRAGRVTGSTSSFHTLLTHIRTHTLAALCGE